MIKALRGNPRRAFSMQLFIKRLFDYGFFDDEFLVYHFLDEDNIFIRFLDLRSRSRLDDIA
jgi:hypothetical protein